MQIQFRWGFSDSSEGKESACNAGDWVQSLGREDPLEEGMGYPLQCSYMENPMNRGAWQTRVYVASKSQT